MAIFPDLILAKSVRDRRGAGLTEYGLLAGLVAVTAIGAVSDAGDRITLVFTDTRAALEDAVVAGAASPDEGTSAPTTNPTPEPEAVFDCYDPGNVGSIAPPDATECASMLIVDNTMLRGAGSGDTGSGDNSFSIVGPDGEAYTFADSERNVFTGQVTDMSHLFADTSFNGDIGYWNTKNVIDMEYMFYEASVFNQDIGGWDVSNVTSMRDVLSYAISFNQDIGEWDVSNVENLRAAFYEASAFNQDIGGWDVSSVTNMEFTFSGAVAFNQDIGGWDVSNVTNMKDVLSYTDTFNQDIGEWDVSNVENLRAAFYYADAFDQDIGGWDVSSVTNMQFTFGEADAFDQDIGNWDVSSVTNMSDAFRDASAFNQDLSGWDVDAVTSCAVFATNTPQWTEPKPALGDC